jgi:hypothetical protein
MALVPQGGGHPSSAGQVLRLMTPRIYLETLLQQPRDPVRLGIHDDKEDESPTQIPLGFLFHAPLLSKLLQLYAALIPI